jgi:hypothetical protein
MLGGELWTPRGLVRSISSRLSFVMPCFYFHLLRPIDRLPLEWPIVGMNVKLRRSRVDPASPNNAKMSHGSCGCHIFAIHRYLRSLSLLTHGPGCYANFLVVLHHKNTSFSNFLLHKPLLRRLLIKNCTQRTLSSRRTLNLHINWKIPGYPVICLLSVFTQ